MKYEAFISYRHGEIDGIVAEQVQKEIEKYRVPGKIAKSTGRKRVGRVFRDADELQASSDLSAVIREALDESEWLIVIASERYNESPWCLEEVEYFTQLRGRDKIIVILVSGEPKDAFPKVLTEVEKDGEIVKIEPLAVDVRAESEQAVRKKLKIERFRFFSSLLGVGYVDLRKRQRERRMRRMLVIFISAFVVFSSIIGIITFKNIQLNKAYDALDESNQNTLRGESYYLAEYADEAFNEGDRQTAIKLALSALPKDLKNPDRPYVADAFRSLTQATGVYDYTAGYHSFITKSREEESYDARTQISPDGKYILIETYGDSINELDREVSVIRTSDGQELLKYKEAVLNRNCYSSGTRGAAFSKDGERLYYLGEDGLTCVNISDGKVVFTADMAVDMRIDPDASAGHTAIITIDYSNGFLYGYDPDGEKTIDMNIGSDMNYELGQIDPKTGLVALAVKTENNYGLLTIDITNGKFYTYPMEGECSDVHFSGENRLCFLMNDTEDGLKHIVQYDTVTEEKRYLCNTDVDISKIILSDKQTCYYYQDNTIYEVDCNDKKGRNIWKHSFASQINSVKVGDELVAVSCQDGSVYVFEENSKRRISTPDAAKDPVYVESVSKQYLTTRDYWGRSIRVYKKTGAESHTDVNQISISDIIGSDIPNSWYTSITNCDRVLLGLYGNTGHQLAEISLEPFEKICSRNITGLQDLDSVNNSFSQYSKKNVILMDYDYYQFVSFDADNLKETYRESLSSNMYVSDDGRYLFITKDGKMKTIDVITGKSVNETDVPSGVNMAVKLGDKMVYSFDDSIRIDDLGGKTLATIKDADFHSVVEKRHLIIYKSTNGENWFAYDTDKRQNVCEGKIKKNCYTQPFGNGRYILIDYSTVYDMDNWHKVLELKPENGNVYGVQTTDDLPYFVVWCRKDSTDSEEKEIGVIYEKNGSGEPVGIIPNYVALATDGEVITYDGEQTLYKFPLLGVEQIKEKAEQMVGNTEFTESQKEKYHLFG